MSEGKTSSVKPGPEEGTVQNKQDGKDLELAAGGLEDLTKEQVSVVFRYPEYAADKNLISAAVPAPPFYVRKVGRMYVLREKIQEDGVPSFVCVVGPCWPMIPVTLTLIAGTSLAVFFGFMPDIPVWLISVFFVSLCVTIISFLLTACRDPGIQRVEKNPRDATWTFSEYAQSYRQPGAIYEQEAQVLIKDIDHFCPWTGTVIAKRNMLTFRIFTQSLCFLIVVTIFLAAYVTSTSK